MEKIYNYENIHEIQDKGNLIGTITYKPMQSIAVVTVVGCLCIILFRNLFGLLFGTFALLISAIVYFAVKDHKVLDVYDKCLLLYDIKDDTRVIKLLLSEIKEWNVNRNENYMISIILTDGSQLGAQTFQINRAQKYLKKVLPRKSTEEIVRKKVNETKSAGFSLIKKKNKG